MELFWQQVEACIAVAMVSFSAFRSVFVAHEARVREARHRNRLWYVDKRNLLKSAWRRKQNRFEYEATDQLPEIPEPTLTGMHTFITEGKFQSRESIASFELSWPYDASRQ